MKKKRFHRFIAAIVAFVLAVSLLPTEILQAASADGKISEPTEASVVITAESENTITVSKRNENVTETDGLISLTAGPYTIQRDYEQECMLKVRNTSGALQEVYLEADNPFADLSMEIIKTGSKDSPAILKPGESMEVELSIFAQNANQTEYTIPVTAYIYQDGNFIQDAKKAVTLYCDLPVLDLTWTKVSEDNATLRQNYLVRNNGDTLTDLEITASESIADYVSFRPVVSNYELARGASVTFSVQPDLAKMKENDVSLLNGTLIASCAGKTSAFDCAFDTKGQEITITTMGELALKQDGNPFSKFEVVEDSISMKYYNGTDYVDFSDTTSLEDVFDENKLVNLQYQSDIDLGVEKPVNFEIELNAAVLEEDADAVDLEPSVSVASDGSINITIKKIIKLQEYQDFVDRSVAEFNGSKLSVRSYAAERGSFEDTDALISYTMKVNDFYGMFDLGSDQLGYLGFAYDIGKLFVDYIVDDYTIYSNPKIPSHVKDAHRGLAVAKTILTIGGFVVGELNPVVGFFFGFAVDWLGDLIDQAQDELLEEYAATYLDILGRQCTNRGSITSSFYVPDYNTKSDQKPSMYTTSRLYADGYVNKTETNYDVTLNAMPAASVQASGLTQTAITEISTEHLKPGEVNTLVFDYDTNPGSHSVNTDTKVTFLYPKDTQIGYIGSPDTLQEVRAMPDFAVYPENIYAEEEFIEGEETELRFHIYNIGSSGGWFTVTVYAGETEIFRQENEYLKAFSSKTCSASWTPGSGSERIRISINNTSVNLGELSSENNTVEKTVTIRQRQIPEIGELSYSAISEQTPYSLVLDVDNCADAADMTFTVDGKEVAHNVRTSGNGNSRRYLITVAEGLEIGEHLLKVSIKYNFAYGTKTVTKEYTIPVEEAQIVTPRAYGYPTGTLLYHERFGFTVTDIENLTKTELILDNKNLVDAKLESSEANENIYSVNAAEFGAGSHIVTIRMYYTDKTGKTAYEECHTEITVLSEEDSYFTFTLEESITDPIFYLFDKETYFEAPCEELEQRTYRFRKNLDMIEHAQNYNLLIQHAAGVLVLDITENAPQITLEDCGTVRFEKKGSAAYAEITEIQIQRIGGEYIGFPLPLSDQISLSPGTYTLLVKGNIGEEVFHRVVAVDTTQADSTISLEDFVLSYYYKMEGTESADWYAQIYYKMPYYTNWNCEELSTLFDAENSMLKCYTTSTSAITQADEAVIVVYSAEEVYALPVKEASFYTSRSFEMEQPKEYTVLDRSSLNKVSLICESEGLQVGTVTAAAEPFTVRFDRNVIYLPDGNYTFRVTMGTGYQSITVDLEDEIMQETELIADKKISKNLADIKVSWAEQFMETAEVFSELSNGKQISAYAFQSGGLLKTETGQQTLHIYLKQENCRFDLQKEINAGEELTELQIGNTFQGKIGYIYGDFTAGGYPTNGTLAFALTELQDENETILSNFYIQEKPLKGNMIYTDVNHADRQFVMPATAEFMHYGTAQLPPESGTYRISLELYTNVKEDVHVHSPVIDPAVGASCTELGWTEGSHCEVCGEALAAQQMIPALGHQYKSVTKAATCLAEGSSLLQCSVCGEVKEGSRKTLPKTGHTWNAGTVTQSATALKTGKKVYTCTVCGASKTETLPKKSLPKKGSVFTDKASKASYKITKSGAANGTVTYVKPTSKTKAAVVPAEVKLDGITYKVTSIAANAWKGNKKLNSVTIGKHITTIGKNAFYGCKNLKKIVIKSTKLKSVGKGAVKGIHKKAVFRAPSAKVRKYRKLFNAKSGFKKTMTIKK